MKRNITKINAKSTLPNKKKVAAYCRVSVTKDATLHSLAAQVSYYQDYISSNPKWLFVGIYADEGISGTKVNRPEFNKMIEDCKLGKIDMIITKSISRFARNTMYLLETTRLLKSLNIDVYFEEQNMHSLSNDGELMLSLLASFAEEEVKSMSNNIRWKVNKFFEEGKVWGMHDFFGYRVLDDNYIINEDEAKVIRFIYDLYLNKDMGVHKIAITLNKLNIQSPNNTRWGDSVVRHILTNVTYTGELLLGLYSMPINKCDGYKKNTGQYPMYHVENSHPEIISKEVFKAVQEKLKISSFYRLYVHYLYLLGKLPPKIHYEERTKEYYQEIDKFNKLADEMSLICTYNLNSKEDTQNLRIKYIEEVAPLKAEREKIRYIYKKTTNEADRSFLEYKLNNLTKDIDKINSKIQTCKRIIATTEKGKKEAVLIKNRVAENQLNNELEDSKNKDKDIKRNR